MVVETAQELGMIVVVRFNEILLKGRNQPFFVRHLRAHIQRVFPQAKVIRIGGGFELHFSKEGTTSLTFQTIEEKFSWIFGLANFSFVRKANVNMENLKKEVLEMVRGEQNQILNMGGTRQPDNHITFGLHTKRIDKRYPLRSTEVNHEVGAFVKEETGMPVNIRTPDIQIFIDIFSKEEAYLYSKKIRASGGLPMGSSASLLSLLSSGFDSPVASYLMMKRGSPIRFLHFHSYPFSSDQSIKNVKNLVRILSRYQGKADLFLAPFGEVQKKLLVMVPKRYLVICYRRMMFCVAELLAKTQKLNALVTGESLGQVASQTVENMSVIEEGNSLPIFRPLLGYDKQEIITLAQKIGTKNISELPYDDCCSRFVPKNPVTRGRLKEVNEIEKLFPKESFIEEIFLRIEQVNLSF